MYKRLKLCYNHTIDKYSVNLGTTMKLNELAKTEAPIDLTPEQLKRANDLAKALATAKCPAEPTLSEDETDEFTEM